MGPTRLCRRRETLLQLTDSAKNDNILHIDGPGDMKIPVRVFGEHGEGVPVLLMHGLQSHSGWFVQSASFLAGLGLPVYSIDRRGSGMSQAPRGECRDFKKMIEDMYVVARHGMEQHNKSKVHVLGHCFGAIPAASFAITHPDLSASLILATPGIHTHSDLTIADKLRVFWSVISGADVHIKVPLEPEMFSELETYVSFIKKDSLSLRYATGLFYFQVLKARNYIKKNVSGLTMPVFMAFAGKDRICDNRSNRKFFDSLPSDNKLLKEYPDARHVLELSTNRDDFFRDLESWIRNQGDR
jgi:alpha-beta hydrolase superfamily lysophospholipase